MNKKKLGKRLMVVCISTLVALICALLVFFNFRAYGMYYASQYYGSDAYYHILMENFKGGFQVANEKKSYRDVFAVSAPGKGVKSIVLDDKEFFVMQSTDDASVITVHASSNLRSYFYEYQKDNRLHFYTAPSDKKSVRNKTLKEDNANFEYYVSQYIDIQLKAVGKPKVNLQWIYNIVQMI